MHTVRTVTILALLLASALALSLLFSAATPAVDSPTSISNQQIWDKLTQLEAKIDALSAVQEDIHGQIQDIWWNVRDIQDQLMWLDCDP